MSDTHPHNRSLLRLDFAKLNALLALSDIDSLVSHQQQLAKTFGGAHGLVQLLRKYVIISSVTAWETYIEDGLYFVGFMRIFAASSPHDVRKAFDTRVAQMQKVDAIEPIEWTGHEWKRHLLQMLKDDVDTLSTPSPDNIRTLSKLHIGSGLVNAWGFRLKKPSQTASEALKDLIVLRGKLTHRSRPDLSPEKELSQDVVERAVYLVRELINASDTWLNEQMLRIYESFNAALAEKEPVTDGDMPDF